jgi:hypothetical protein
MMVTVGADGKPRPMTVLPRRSIPMWAATLDTSRCAPEVPTLRLGQVRRLESRDVATLSPSCRAATGPGWQPRKQGSQVPAAIVDESFFRRTIDILNMTHCR